VRSKDQVLVDWNDVAKDERCTDSIDPAPHHAADVPPSYYCTSTNAIFSAGLFNGVPTEVPTYAILAIVVVVKPSTRYRPFPPADGALNLP
jgi:hypothetical protein